MTGNFVQAWQMKANMFALEVAEIIFQILPWTCDVYSTIIVWQCSIRELVKLKEDLRKMQKNYVWSI